VVKLTEKAMREAFLAPITDADREKTSNIPGNGYQRLVTTDISKASKSYPNFNLAKELSKLNTKSYKRADTSSSRSGNVTKADCIYCKLVMRRLDLYQAHQFGITSERMLIYKRMQKQIN